MLLNGILSLMLSDTYEVLEAENGQVACSHFASLQNAADNSHHHVNA